MKTSQQWLRMLCVAVSLGTSASHAQTLDFQYDNPGVDPGLPVDGTISGATGISPYPSGVMNFSDAPGGGISPSFQAFCVQPQVLLSYGELATYTVSDISGLANSSIISQLISMYLDSDQDEMQAAAVQWAIWEITSETSGTYSLTQGSGNVYIAAGDADISALANSYLAGYSIYAPVSLTYLTSEDAQNVVTWQVIPEPSSALLLGIASAALLGRRRRL